MTRWEYATIRGGHSSAKTVLETMGQQGWEYCGKMGTEWLLKRPLPPPAPEPKTSHFIMGEQVIAPRTATEVSAMEALHRWQANWKQAFNELRASLTVKSIADRGYMPLVISAKRVLDLMKDDLTQDDRGEPMPPNAPREVPQDWHCPDCWKQLPEVPKETGWVMVRHNCRNAEGIEVETKPALFTAGDTPWPWMYWSCNGEHDISPEDIIEWHPLPQ